jgi:hypothetical protein
VDRDDNRPVKFDDYLIVDPPHSRVGGVGDPANFNEGDITWYQAMFDDTTIQWQDQLGRYMLDRATLQVFGNLFGGKYASARCEKIVPGRPHRKPDMNKEWFASRN